MMTERNNDEAVSPDTPDETKPVEPQAADGAEEAKDESAAVSVDDAAAADEDAQSDVVDAPGSDESSAEDSSKDEYSDDAEGEGDAGFPAPHSLKVEADQVPVDDDERDADDDQPFDTEEAFAVDADTDEFLEGQNDEFVDDSKNDYYDYDYNGDGIAEPDEHADDASDEHDEGIPDDQPPAPVSSGAKHGRHAQGKSAKKSKKDKFDDVTRRHRRSRRLLIFVIILLICLVGALAFFGFQLFQESQRVASQQVTATSSTSESSSVKSTQEGSSRDSGTTTVKKTDVPSLTALMGHTQDECITLLAHGAQASSSREVNEEGNPVKTQVTVMLTDEPADSKSGTPTVYLGLGEDGTVVQAGYSAATASLGYGSISFADAVSNEHIVEKTLTEAGLTVDYGTVQLPAKATYSTYASDGTTLVKESCSFSGTAPSSAGVSYDWSSVLTYDYAAANASGNLADTIRQIYVYVSAAS